MSEQGAVGIGVRTSRWRTLLVAALALCLVGTAPTGAATADPADPIDEGDGATDEAVSSTDDDCPGEPHGPQPEAANVAGSAHAGSLHLDLLPLLGPSRPVLDTGQLLPTSNAQTGPGTSGDHDEVAAFPLPGTLTGAALQSQTLGTVDATSGEATQTSVARVADLDILGGLVTADLVQAVASTTATGDRAAFTSAGSTFTNLAVAGVAVTDVAPNTRIELDPQLFGPASYVALLEETGSTSQPAAGQLEGGTYAADLEVTMIRVHITRSVPLGQHIDIVVGHADAHSEVPQTTRCQLPEHGSIAAHAYTARLHTRPALADSLLGFVRTGPDGGHEQQNLVGVRAPGDGPFPRYNGTIDVSTTNAEGDPTYPLSFAWVEAAGICLSPQTRDCLVAAEAASSSASVSARTTPLARGESAVAGLRSGGGEPLIPAEASTPNTVVDLGPLGFLIINEQFCDAGASLANRCHDGGSHAGITVRALRLVVLDPGPDGLLGTELILSESYAAATSRSE